MKLTDYLGTALDAPIAAVRRQVIALAIAGTCAIAALILCIVAGVLALEPLIGAPLACLAVAAILLIIGVVAFFAPRLFHRQSFTERAQAEAEGLPRDQKIAMIIEALILGFSMSHRAQADKSGK